MGAKRTSRNGADEQRSAIATASAARAAPLTIAGLRNLYRHDAATAVDVIRDVYERVHQAARPDVWISIRPQSQAMAAAEALASRPRDALPLYGIPFAVKDNIDVAGLPTTAACPSYAYTPAASAACVAALEQAGAICVGKTNLDQFATGLCGVRSPYGACGSAYDSKVIAGGSSSGSAVAVALGQVAFSLGTDTGGSGRIPAAFNNVVGLKPTVGTIPTRGAVPNCRTLDCISVFAQTVSDAVLVADMMRVFDERDPFSRNLPSDFAWGLSDAGQSFRFGVVRDHDLEFFGNREAPALYCAAIRRMEEIGGTAVPVDFAPFRAAGALLFDGPWIAERAAAIGAFVQEHPEAVLPVIRSVLGSAARWNAVDMFAALHRRQALKREVEQIFTSIDALVVPTAGTSFTIAEMEAEPVERNTMLGFYSYFVNLLDLCAVATPNGFYGDGIPAGITLVAPAFHDNACATIAQRFHQAFVGASSSR